MAAANEARQRVHQILRQWTLQKFQEKATTKAMRTMAMRTMAMTKAMKKMADSVVADNANAGNAAFYTFYLCNGLFE